MRTIRVAIAQLNMVVGDLEGNVDHLIQSTREAESNGCDLIVFPELAVTGYPPEDLLLKPAFVDDNRAALERFAASTGSCAAVVGFVDRDADGEHLFNAAAVCANGAVVGTYRKRRLPNYAVFDEQRYFTSGSQALQLFRVAGVRVGVSICEDAWAAGGPIRELADGGAELIVNLNASPYHAGKVRARELMLAERAGEASCPIVYVNLVGGQDELVFDGASLVVDSDGSIIVRGAQFAEAVLITDLDVKNGTGQASLSLVEVSDERSEPEERIVPSAVDMLDPDHEIYEALVLGTRDYVLKNGFTDVVVGLSGGVDSSLVAAIAVDALGAEHVHGVLMPSRYSSDHSITDAEELCDNLGIERRTVAIEPAHNTLLTMLGPSFGELAADTTEENLQPRIRGMVLMALSNKFGWLVLTTGNKSEMAVGYATLYGDMAGGYAVIKDVPKTVVYRLCADRNARAGRSLIPDSVMTKPPSAELRPDQLDVDSLPPYDVLDPILEAYVERDQTVGDLVADGYDEALVRRIARLVDLAEYKRRQAPPGPRVTTKAFGKDRRLPLTNRYRG